MPSPVSLRDFDAVLFDLDGVLTTTRTVHAAAWKRTFDEFLVQVGRHARNDDPLHSTRVRTTPPTSTACPARKGCGPSWPRAASGSRRRARRTPQPTRSRSGASATVSSSWWRTSWNARGSRRSPAPSPGCGSCARPGSGPAVVSSSRNCAAVLELAGISNLFDARVDGETALELGLPGKPAPDAFLEGARRLDVSPGRSRRGRGRARWRGGRAGRRRSDWSSASTGTARRKRSRRMVLTSWSPTSGSCSLTPAITSTVRVHGHIVFGQRPGGS